MGCILLLIYYFKFMVTSRFLDVNIIFFYKNLIKKKSKLNLLFIGKECNAEYPRLKPIAITFLLGVIIEVLIVINMFVAIFLKQTKEITNYVGLVLMIIMLIALIGSLLYCGISNIKLERKLDKTTQEELKMIRRKIETEWSNFFIK